MIKFLSSFFEKKVEKRNFAVANSFISHVPFPEYTDWNIQNAVRYGYKVNPWVYRCVTLIAKNGASVKSAVVDKNGEIIIDHPVSTVLNHPNSKYSRQDLAEMIFSAINLAGNSYLYRNKIDNKTEELWFISPDRIAPIQGRTATDWVDYYSVDNGKIKYNAEQIIHHKFTADPSNPIIGISPLQVVGKTVDSDVSMRDFNTAMAQNRGVLDGIFTFARDFASVDETTPIEQKLEEKIGKKRGFIVLPSSGKYQKVALSPSEMDFMESRKANRDEILITFGVPLPLITQDRATYNNYQVSEEIFWTLTLIPMLSDLYDTYNFAFYDELQEGEKIIPLLQNVDAIRRMMRNKAETAEKFHKMGVPFEQLNKVFEFSFQEFAGWDKPVFAQQTPSYMPDQRKSDLTLKTGFSFQKVDGWDKPAFAQQSDLTLKTDIIQLRELQEEIEDYAEKTIQKKIDKLLKAQKKAVFYQVDRSQYDKIQSVVEDDRSEWIKVLTEIYIESAIKFSKKVVIETREDALSDLLTAYFENETAILTELSFIEETTVSSILEAVQTGLKDGLSNADIQQRIIDSGILEPSRALMLSRTITGTAASIGQYQSAKSAGASHKIWDAAGKHARPEHGKNPPVGRNGEKVKIDERFSPKFKALLGPMYPLDHVLKPADRVNCRCSMRFVRETNIETDDSKLDEQKFKKVSKKTAKENLESAADRIVLPKFADVYDYKLVDIDVKKLDAAWSKDPLYIDKSHDDAIDGRIESATEYFESGEPIDAVEIVVDEKGNVMFTDGRHRFVTFRDIVKADNIKVAMDPDSIKNAKKFGLI